MLKKLFFFVSFLLLLTGCAIKNNYADFTYIPTSSKSKLSVVKNLSLQIHDQRKLEDVGYIQNVLGMKTARILPKKKISSIFQASLEKALLTKGIAVGPSDRTLLVTITKCFTDYSGGLFYEKAIADLSLTLNILNSEGTSLYFKKIEARGIESPVFIYSGKNASKALTKGVSKALEELLNDELFLKTL